MANGLIDFNDMLTNLGLFKVKMLGNPVHFTMIFTFFRVVSVEYFSHDYIKYSY